MATATTWYKEGAKFHRFLSTSFKRTSRIWNKTLLPQFFNSMKDKVDYKLANMT
jgi:hypothetical protein